MVDIKVSVIQLYSKNGSVCLKFPHYCLRQIKSTDLDLEDKECPQKPNKLKASLDEAQYVTFEKMTETINVTGITVSKRLNSV